MTFSLNEVEATAKRAARGAGYSWGMAEEAGKAARWLCARDVDGCAALSGLLRQFHGAAEAEWAPHIDRSQWQAKGGRLCPLLAGTAISDRARALETGEISLSGLVEPVLLLPFVASCARHLEMAISIRLPGATAETDGEELAIVGAFPALAESVDVSIGGKITARQTRRSRADPAPDTWQVLNRFAQRTFAPATEASRLTGAGAGLSDND